MFSEQKEMQGYAYVVLESVLNLQGINHAVIYCGLYLVVLLNITS